MPTQSSEEVASPPLEEHITRLPNEILESILAYVGKITICSQSLEWKEDLEISQTVQCLKHL